MVSEPRATILLPVRNGFETLDACLRSVQRQTERAFELLVVDDGSTDATPELLADWRSREPRLRVLPNPGEGLVAALNAGLDAARAPVVCRMDADDLMVRDRLAIQLSWLDAHPEFVVVGSRVRIFPRRTLQAGYRAYEQWLNAVVAPAALHDALLVEAPLAHPSVCFRRSVIQQLGGYRDGPFPEDYDLWLRCRAAGIGLGKVPRTLVAWRDHPDRTSRRSKRYSRDAFARLRADHMAADPTIRARRLVLWGAGKRSRRFVRLLVERGVEFSHWIDIDPRKVGQRYLEREVLTPDDSLDRRRSGDLLLVLVSNHGARQEIDAWLAQRGLRQGRDYLHVGT